MELPFTGGCLCGEVRYECHSSPLMMLNCHCRDCQHLGGGAYAPIVVISMRTFKLTAGTLKRHVTTRLSGRRNLRGFCAECGTRITVGEDPDRDILGLMASTLSDPSWFKPTQDIFVCDAQPWDFMDADLPKYQHYTPRK